MDKSMSSETIEPTGLSEQTIIGVKPRKILVMGLPGAGKTTLTRALAPCSRRSCSNICSK
jgi:GTPase SAR1 family protein